MNRLLPAVALVCLLAMPARAGETNGPGYIPPPPPPPMTCTENCSQSTSEPTLADWAILLLIQIISQP